MIAFVEAVVRVSPVVFVGVVDGLVGVLDEDAKVEPFEGRVAGEVGAVKQVFGHDEAFSVLDVRVGDCRVLGVAARFVEAEEAVADHGDAVLVVVDQEARCFVLGVVGGLEEEHVAVGQVVFGEVPNVEGGAREVGVFEVGVEGVELGDGAGEAVEDDALVEGDGDVVVADGVGAEEFGEALDGLVVEGGGGEVDALDGEGVGLVDVDGSVVVVVGEFARGTAQVVEFGALDFVGNVGVGEAPQKFVKGRVFVRTQRPNQETVNKVLNASFDGEPHLG